MDFDNLAKEQSDRVYLVWIQNLLRNVPEELAGKLASQHYPGTPVTASRLRNGAFNICYRVTYDNGHRVVVRFTALGRAIARNEKVEDEVSIMNYVAQHTTIPVPKVLGHGKCAVGPYIVMSFIEGDTLSGYLRDPLQETATLSSKISMSVLKRAYFGMAEVLLELSKPEFPYIGAIRKDESGVWTVPKRPLTFNMNRLAQFSNIPHSVFGQQHFSTAADYFEELAQQHFYHLEFQRNDAIADRADCRKKYVARCLFRKLSREVSKAHCSGPFRLYCDDLHPDNVLVDASKLVVSGVVDWEFTYAAPVEFTYAAPWWLLLQRPENWDDDLEQFLARFMPRFLRYFRIARQEKPRTDP
ncbi:phosphotransferase enzyme family protein [Penicillium bovifimosum]|uniref:Phosphotransferase enzyme family protein n=1 Tax=Penicillium bovifimosum TaxID=126998 RepID=A0A9W9KVN9_9EURO|nr:phosphotransferase enzyme family protein [Penicillium bovifimosum]KAJ5123909.1 phosphotransferase enzyme family protein [Penicillium bovifimosum]